MTENLSYCHKLGFEEVERRTEHGFRRVFLHKWLGRGTSSKIGAPVPG